MTVWKLLLSTVRVQGLYPTYPPSSAISSEKEDCQTAGIILMHNCSWRFDSTHYVYRRINVYTGTKWTTLVFLTHGRLKIILWKVIFRYYCPIAYGAVSSITNSTVLIINSVYNSWRLWCRILGKCLCFEKYTCIKNVIIKAYESYTHNESNTFSEIAMTRSDNFMFHWVIVETKY